MRTEFLFEVFIRFSVLSTYYSVLKGYRPVALTARASDSKSEGWGFESLLACQLK